MSSRSRIPPAIEQLIRLPPEASLTLLTGTLGCSPSWITSRFVGRLLAENSPTQTGEDERSACRIVLVSWLQDLAFWKTDVRRAMGLDISKAIETKQLIFVDCLSASASIAHTNALDRAEEHITEAITKISSSETKSNIFLILDSPDLLLASASATAQQLNLFVLKLRSITHSVLLTCSADQPLLQATSSTDGLERTPLEIEGSRFLTQQAHNAWHITSVRELATGAARDVSGVLRVTRSARVGILDEDAADSDVGEMEALYLVSRDGGVKVFQRGTEAV